MSNLLLLSTVALGYYLLTYNTRLASSLFIDSVKPGHTYFARYAALLQISFLRDLTQTLEAIYGDHVDSPYGHYHHGPR